MPTFIVMNFKDGSPDGEARRVEATNEQAAAEKVCRTSLVEAFQLRDLRAMVTPVGIPTVRKLFRLPVLNPRASHPSS